MCFCFILLVHPAQEKVFRSLLRGWRQKPKIIENENGFLSRKDGHLLFLDPLLLLQGPPGPPTEASGSERLQVSSKEMVPAGGSVPGT